MSPRVIPKPEREQRRRRLAIVSAELERARRLPSGPARQAAIEQAGAALRDALRRDRPAAGPPTTELPPDAYTLDPALSYFADLIWGSDQESLRNAIPPPNVKSAGEARRRLASVEKRDLSSASTGLMSAPPLLSEAFAASARAAGAMQDLLPNRPMPSSGMTVDAVRLTTGDSVAAQAGDLQAVSNTDLVEAKLQSPIATITGFVDLSLQLLDQGQAVDVAIAEELGRAYAQALDTQVISGSGSAGQMQGLRGVSGIVSVTFTTPVTPLGALAKLSDAVGQVNTAYGSMPDVVVMHGRRLPWFLGQSASPTPINWPGVRPVVCNSIPTNIGGGTEDVLLVLASEAHPLYTTAPRVRVLVDFSDGVNLTARILIDGYAAVQSGRYPSAIGVVSGAGLISPTYV